MKRFIAIFIAMCLILVVSSVSVFAATVGELLSTPEEGWKRVDRGELSDYVIKTDSWGEQGNSYNPNAGYTFQFKGDKIRLLKIYSDRWTSRALHARVDGVDYHSKTFTEFSEADYLAIEVTGLTHGIHTVEILGTYVDASHHIIVYSVDIPNDGYIVGSKMPNQLSVMLDESEQAQLSISRNLTNNANFIWSSTNEAVATVDEKGKVTAVAAGETDIYAKNADDTFSEYIPVKVVEGIADELRLAVHLNTGEKTKLYLAEEENTVTWSSMDESIATISSGGQVTAVGKGLAVIKAELDGETYQIYVRVNS